MKINKNTIMRQVPFDERFENTHIYTHELKINSAFWIMDSKDEFKGVALSNVGLFNTKFTNTPTNKELVTDIILILRNQSDYSNVIILIGTFSYSCVI